MSSKAPNRKQAQAQEQNQAQNFDFSLLNELPVGVCLFKAGGKDPFQIVFWSKRLADWTQVPKGNAEGTSLLKQMPALNLPEVIEQIDQVGKTRSGASSRLLVFEEGATVCTVRFAKAKGRSYRFHVSRAFAQKNDQKNDQADEGLLMLSVEDVSEV